MNLNPRPWMTDAEVDFLGKHIRLTDTVFEYGGGGSTLWLAPRCRWLITVEHKRDFAATLVQLVPDNVQIIYAPPDMLQSDPESDGDPSEYRRYTRSYTGESVDVVIVDGRNRIDCVRHVVQTAMYGVHPGLKVFLHDCQRDDMDRCWRDDPKWGKGYMREVQRVDNLMLMEPRL